MRQSLTLSTASSYTSGMLVEEKVTIAHDVQVQVDRIVASEQFRTCQVLRRLLLFLTERTLAGDADNLKEYVIAIDGLGKASTYDPQHNSAVRIQVGRLRQRLAEYYREEGKDDPIVVELPKGHFRLTFEHRSAAAMARRRRLRRRSPGAAGTSQASVGCGASTVRENGRALPQGWHRACSRAVAGRGIFAGTKSAARRTAPTMSHDLATLGTDLGSKLPLILSIEDPLFAEIRSNPGVYFVIVP